MSNFNLNFGDKKKGKGPAKSIFAPPPPQKKKINFGNTEPNIEADSEVELNELQLAFRSKAKAEKELKDKNTSPDYWSCILFKNEEQMDKFYELLGLQPKDAQYINGQNLIKALELRIALIEEKAPGKFKVNKSILDLSLNPIF